jgi:hypothetical protein
MKGFFTNCETIVFSLLTIRSSVPGSETNSCFQCTFVITPLIVVRPARNSIFQVISPPTKKSVQKLNAFVNKSQKMASFVDRDFFLEPILRFLKFMYSYNASVVVG